MSNHVSVKNSTINILNANETYTGTIENVSNYNSININLYSDQNSDNTGLKILFYNTTDETRNSNNISYSYFKNISKNYNIPIKGKFIKIIYNNGPVNQNNFTLRTTFNHVSNNIRTIDFNNIYLDTFNRLRVSKPQTLLDISQIYSKNNLKEDEYINGTGSITHNVNESTNTLSVSTNNDRAIRQSRLYTTYQPGKSFLIYLTGVINNNNNGINTASRLGYYDDNNGLYFEYNNNIMYIVKRTYTSGSVVNTRIEQSSWNIDPVNGNGISSIDLDFSKYLIYTINFSWLGAGIVDIGIFYSGIQIIVHRFNNSDISIPYMTTPNLPSRYEIISTSATNGAGQLKQGCVSINSECGQNLIGQIFSKGTISTHTIDDTESYIMAIKLKENTRKLVRLQSISLICTSKGDIEYKIYMDLSPTTSPITVGSSFTDVNTNSVVQYDESGTSFDSSSSILLYQGYFSTIINIDVRELSNKGDPIYLTGGINVGTYYSDYIYVTGKNISNSQNESINITLNWIEI